MTNLHWVVSFRFGLVLLLSLSELALASSGARDRGQRPFESFPIRGSLITGFRNTLDPCRVTIGFLVEHGGNGVPSGAAKAFREGEYFKKWRRTHHAWDKGAYGFALGLSQRAAGSKGVACHVTRMYADVNRAAPHDAWLLKQADKQCLPFNLDLQPPERSRRLSFHNAYHEAVNRSVNDCDLLVSVHSFEPRKDVELNPGEHLGLLFDGWEADRQNARVAGGNRTIASVLRGSLRQRGVVAASNRPYVLWADHHRGFRVLPDPEALYGPQMYGRALDIPYLLLELMSDRDNHSLLDPVAESLIEVGVWLKRGATMAQHSWY